MSFQDALSLCATETEALLDRSLPADDAAARRVVEAMRYSALGQGKRLRPFLVVESAALFGVPRKQALRVGAALECVHCYSLVHDDLPAMDDDDLRRGKPTAHKAFDEATAILAGDALLTFAFEILSDEATHPDPQVRINLHAAAELLHRIRRGEALRPAADPEPCVDRRVAGDGDIGESAHGLVPGEVPDLESGVPCPLRVQIFLPVAASQTITELSWLPLTMRVSDCSG